MSKISNNYSQRDLAIARTVSHAEQERCMHVRRQCPCLRMVSLISNITIADTASEDDPNEISFSRGEILDIINRNGNWWQARKGDGTSGST